MKRLVELIESYLGRFLLWIACLLLVVFIYSNETASASSWSAEDWQALGAIATAAIAVLAVVVAVGQLRDARELRWEQAAPYVVAYLEADEAKPQFIYLYVKNFGATAARDVRFVFDSPPTRSAKVGGGELALPSQMPFLVPGQAWSTFWDFSPARYQERDQHMQQFRLRVSYMDSRDNSHVMDSVIDWDAYMGGRRWIDRKTIHDVAKRLEKIEGVLGRIENTLAPRE